jgi:MFS family permease
VDVRWLFVADAVSCLACAGVVWWRLPGRTGPVVARGAGCGPWRDRRLLLLLGLGTGLAVVYLQVTITLPLTVTARGLPVSLVGLLLTVSAATVVLAQPLLAHPRWGRLADPSAIAVGFVVLAVGLALTGLATSAAGYVASTVVWSVGDVLIMGRAYALVSAIAPATARGRYLAAYGTSWGAAAVVAPLLGTQLLGRAGPEATWAWLGVACLVLAAAYGLLRGPLGRAVPGRADG